MLKKLIVYFIYMVSSLVNADTVRHDVEVELFVPKKLFYVVSNDHWEFQTQRLYQDAKGALQPLVRTLQVYSATGDVAVRPADGVDMMLRKDRDEIPLMVSLQGSNQCDVVANARMRSQPCTLLTAESMKTGAQSVRLVLRADPPPNGGYVPGQYQGQVSLMFETPL